MTPEQIYSDAMTAAKNAEREFMEQHGEPMYCGFSWVRIDKARQPFVTWLKKNNIGDKPYVGRGWHIWNPAGNNTQSMDIKMTGARAFAKVLRDNGIEAYADCRAD